MTTSLLDRSLLREFLATRFSVGELRTLCFDLNFDYDDISGSTHTDKAREVIIYLERRNRLMDLVKVGQGLRPDIPWNSLRPIDITKQEKIPETEDINTNPSGLAIIYFSYTRYDDANESGEISRFIDVLAKEISNSSNIEIKLYQDLSDPNTKRQIRSEFSGEIFILIAIISRNYFASDWCREEIELFLDRENYLQNKHLIIPIYYQDDPNLNKISETFSLQAIENDKIFTEVANRGRIDYRYLRGQNLSNDDVVEKIKFIANHIRVRINYAATRIKRNIDDKFSLITQNRPFIDTYYDWWQGEYGRINTFGLRDVGEPPKVRDIFVNLRINPGKLGNTNRNLLGPSKLEKGKQIWYFLQAISESDESKSNLTLVVLGPAGFGKTTLLQHIAISFSSDEYYQRKIRRYIPFLLYLREQSNVILSNTSISLAQLLQNYYEFLHPSTDWFEQQLKEGRCIVLLDGMDEIPYVEDRRNIANWIDNQIKIYPRARFVITSRPGGYEEAPIQHSRRSILNMQPFTSEQRMEFLEKWYISDFKRSETSTSSASKILTRARTKANEVVISLKSRPALNDFSGNPLLLTMIAIAARDEGILPESRIELYREFYDVLLYRRTQRKGIKEFIKNEKKDEVVRQLAFFMMKNKLSEISYVQAIKVAEPRIRHLRLRQKDPDFDIIMYIHNTTNLIVPVSGDKWIFAHATFREYAAAKILNDTIEEINWNIFVQDNWWHETLIFYAAMFDATPIIATCLKENTLSALVLAIMCLEETSEVDPKVEMQLNKLLTENLGSDDHERRTLAAEIQLTHRLKNLQFWHYLDNYVAIDIRPITYAEYQLFLDYMRSRDRLYHPKHWTSPYFPPSDASLPVSGIFPDQASEFCSWLNSKEKGIFSYRLPNKDELSDVNLRKFIKYPGCNVWCTDNGKYEIHVSSDFYSCIIDYFSNHTEQNTIPILTPSFLFKMNQENIYQSLYIIFNNDTWIYDSIIMQFIRYLERNTEDVGVNSLEIERNIDELLGIFYTLSNRESLTFIENDLIQAHSYADMIYEITFEINNIFSQEGNLNDDVDFRTFSNQINNILFTCGDIYEFLTRMIGKCEIIFDKHPELHEAGFDFIERISKMQEKSKLTKQTIIAIRKEWRETICNLIIEYWKVNRKRKSFHNKESKIMAYAYWHLKIISLQENSHIEPFGELRLVRETKIN